MTKLLTAVNVAPALAATVVRGAGATPLLTSVSYAVATAGDWLVPGVPAGSLTVVAVAGPIAVYRLLKR